MKIQTEIKRLFAIGGVSALAILAGTGTWMVTRSNAQAGVSTAEPQAIQVSASQEQALSDDAVTMAELNLAVDAYAECVSAQGPTLIEDAPAKGLRPRQVRFEVPAPDGDASAIVQELQATVTACRSEHLDNVQIRWAQQQVEPTADEVDSLFTWLEECLAGEHAVDAATNGGWTLYENRSLEVQRSEGELYAQCGAEARALFGLTPPLPSYMADGMSHLLNP